MCYQTDKHFLAFLGYACFISFKYNYPFLVKNSSSKAVFVHGANTKGNLKLTNFKQLLIKDKSQK